MNMQEPGLRIAIAEDARERFSPERSSLELRTAAVAKAAAADVEEVDRGARFPQKAIDAARQARLLGVQIPIEFGGDGASSPACDPLLELKRV